MNKIIEKLDKEVEIAFFTSTDDWSIEKAVFIPTTVKLNAVLKHLHHRDTELLKAVAVLVKDLYVLSGVKSSEWKGIHNEAIEQAISIINSFKEANEPKR